MKSAFGKFGLLMVAAFLSASAAFGQVPMQLTGTGDSLVVQGVYQGSSTGIYADPYTATVGTANNVPVICDDWSNNTYSNESWKATAITVASLNSGTNATAPMFGALSALNNPTPSGAALTQAELYDEIAYLSSQLLSNPTNNANQVATSFALWELTYQAAGSNVDPTSPTSFLGSSTQWKSIQNCTSPCVSVNSLLTAAQNAVLNNGYTGQGWEILTPIPGSSNPLGDGTPQEFMVYTPESSTAILFGADMIGLLALAFVFRRRLLVPLN